MIRIPLKKPATPAPAPSPAPAADPGETWTILGIDTSTTRMGLVVLRAAKHQPPEVLDAVSSAHTELQSHNRQRAQTGDIIDLLNRHRPDFVVIEGTVVHGVSGGSSSAKILGQAGVVRYVVNQYGYEYREVTPSELKRFVTGNGSAKKPQMKAAVEKRWGYKAKNHDVADAYGLAMMGLASAGLVLRLSQEEREILGNMKIERPGA